MSAALGPKGRCPSGLPTLAAVRLGGWGLRSLRSLRSQPQSQRLGSLHRRQGAESSPLRGCGPHQPLDPCSVPSGGRVKARAATPKGHGLDADGTTNAQARGQVEQSEAARPPAPLPRGERTSPLGGARQWGDATTEGRRRAKPVEQGRRPLQPPQAGTTLR